MKFLITGANGDIAKSICKIIKKNFNDINVDGTDVKGVSSKRSLYNKIYKVPLPDNKIFKKIKKLSKNYKLIIPATENEVIFFKIFSSF